MGKTARIRFLSTARRDGRPFGSRAVRAKSMPSVRSAQGAPINNWTTRDDQRVKDCASGVFTVICAVLGRMRRADEDAGALGRDEANTATVVNEGEAGRRLLLVGASA